MNLNFRLGRRRQKFDCNLELDGSLLTGSMDRTLSVEQKDCVFEKEAVARKNDFVKFDSVDNVNNLVF